MWITGASSGIGAALAKEIAQHKGKLILSARSLDKLEAVKQECSAYTDMIEIIKLDVADPDSIRNAWSLVGIGGWEVDILINNSGISQRSIATETSMKVVRQIMEVNFFGAVSLTTLVAEQMVKRQTGYIVVIGSLSGKFGWKLRSTYAASKFAIQGYYESLRAEIAEFGTKVLIVIPGRIQTNISMNAVLGDGTANQQMDPAQKGGIPTSICAQKIVAGIKKNKKEIIIARFERLMIPIRFLLPSLYYRIAAKRDPNI